MALKYPFGFDHNGNIVYPFIKKGDKKLLNYQILGGNACGLTFDGILLSYVHHQKTPYFRSQAKLPSSVDQASINMRAVHLLVQCLIQKKKEVPIPSTQRYLLGDNERVSKNWSYDGKNVLYKDGKGKCKSIKEYVLRQTEFNENKGYRHNLTEIDYGGDYFGISTVKREVSGGALLNELNQKGLIADYLDEGQLKQFCNKRFDVVAYNADLQPFLIVEIIVTKKVEEEKHCLLKRIGISSIQVEVETIDPDNPEIFYPLNTGNTFWIKNTLFEEKLSLLELKMKELLVNNHQTYFKEEQQKAEPISLLANVQNEEEITASNEGNFNAQEEVGFLDSSHNDVSVNSFLKKLISFIVKIKLPTGKG